MQPMPSYLIACPLPDLCLNEALKLRKKISPQSPDYLNDPETFIIHPEKQSIGIDQIRQLKNLLPQKPASGHHRFAIIHLAETLTIPAQNALLKLLEEPPTHTTVILTAPSKHSLLPTIQSRCQLVNIVTPSPLTKSQLQDQSKTFQNISDSSISQRLTLAPKLVSSRSSAIEFCQSQSRFLHQQLISNPSYSLSHLHQNINQTLKVLNSNANYLLALENLLLSYPPLKST
jgi:hypothetical protein